jgi:hypothetical protein
MGRHTERHRESEKRHTRGEKRHTGVMWTSQFEPRLECIDCADAGTDCEITGNERVSANHFFVGLGAGIAILAVPVIALTPGRELPQQLVGWIEGPPPQARTVKSDDAGSNRPQRGYKPGDPTPGPAGAPPTLGSVVKPTQTPAPAPQVQPPVMPSISSLRTGVIRSGGAPVPVHRVAGVDSGDDPLIADRSPVLVSTDAALQIGGELWRAIRGLSGIAGWVPGSQVAVDGEPAPLQVMAAAAAATPSSNAQRGVIANADGAGVVLRNSPNDLDRTRSGLMDGAAVTLLERSGSEWVRVRADNGLTGWISLRYLVAN